MYSMENLLFSLSSSSVELSIHLRPLVSFPSCQLLPFKVNTSQTSSSPTITPPSLGPRRVALLALMRWWLRRRPWQQQEAQSYHVKHCVDAPILDWRIFKVSASLEAANQGQTRVLLKIEAES